MATVREPLETSELLAFTKTVDSRSLSRAAAELGVPRATISRRLARLEERLGTRLLRRTTRTLALTDAGDALYRHARLVLEAAFQAEDSVRRTDDAVRGELRVSVVPFRDPSFSAAIAAFIRKYPDVRLQLHVSSQFVDLKRDGYDVVVRGTGAHEPGFVARTLLRDLLVAVASPAYVQEHGVPRSRRDLSRHRCLMGFDRGELPSTRWAFEDAVVPVDGVFFSNDMHTLVGAAMNGIGIAAVPFTLVHEHLKSGALVHLLPGVLDRPSHTAAVYVEREFVLPQVRAFVDAMVAWASKVYAADRAAIERLTAGRKKTRR